MDNKNDINIISLIRENHKLLNKIGVVPQNICNFINEIEVDGGAAKKYVSLGSIKGDRSC